jgi:hypothetical protein
VPWPRRRLRPLLAVAAAVALLAAAASPPGRAVLGSLRDAVGRERVVGVERARPALASLPAPGRLLVSSARGPWIVRADGSKRLLGRYDEASWSPQGLFVVATRDRELVALEPNGAVRWTLDRPRPIANARWAPSGFRIAYLSGERLRVVAGDGRGDRLLVARAAPVAPAWRPEAEHVLALVGARGLVRVVAADDGRTLWAAAAPPGTVELEWSTDGRRLLARGRTQARVYTAAGELERTIGEPGLVLTAAAFLPGSHDLALAGYSALTGRGSVRLYGAERGGRPLFAGAGRLDDLAWSPNGRWLLVAWPQADQWVFVGMPEVRRLVAVSGIGRQFSPGAGSGPFPRVEGWCC